VQPHACKILLNLHIKRCNNCQFRPISFSISTALSVSNHCQFRFALHQTKDTMGQYAYSKLVKQRCIYVHHYVDRKSQEEGAGSLPNVYTDVTLVLGDFFIIRIYDWVV
jgi:hypothetical protein